MKLAVTGCPRNCAESLRQGRRRGGHRGRPVGDLRRRRGRRAHPQGRPAVHRRRRRDASRCSPAGSCSTTGRTPSGWSAPTRSCPRVGLDQIRAVVVDDSDGIADAAGRRDAGARRPPTWTRGPGRRAGHARASSAPRCRWRCCRRCRPTGPSSCWAVRGERASTALGPRPARPGRPDPARRGPGLRGRRRAGRRLPAARRQPARRCRRSARTRAGRSPTGRSTRAIVLCPLHLNAFELATGCSTTGRRAAAGATTSTVVDDEIVLTR